MKYQEVTTANKKAVRNELVNSLLNESLFRFRHTFEKNGRYDDLNTTHLPFSRLPEYWSPASMPQLKEFLENIPEESPLRSLPLEREPFKEKMGELITQFTKECEEYCNEEFLIQASEAMRNNISISDDREVWLGGNAYPVWPVLHRWFGWWFFQPIRNSLDISSATFISQDDWKKEMGDMPMTWKTVNEYCASKGGSLAQRHEIVKAVNEGSLSLEQPEYTEGGLGPCILTPTNRGVRMIYGPLSGGTCFRYM